MLIHSRNLEMKKALRNAISFDTRANSAKQNLKPKFLHFTKDFSFPDRSKKHIGNLLMKTPTQKIKISTFSKNMNKQNEKNLKFQLNLNLKLKKKYPNFNKQIKINGNVIKGNQKKSQNHTKNQIFENFQFIQNLWSRPNKPYFLCALARDIYNDNQRIAINGKKIQFSNNSSFSGKNFNSRKHFRVHSTISNSSKGNYALSRSFPFESHFTFNCYSNLASNCSSQTKNKRNLFELNPQTKLFIEGREQFSIPFCKTISEQFNNHHEISSKIENIENTKEEEKEKVVKNNMKIQKILINLPPVVILKDIKI